MNFTCHSKEYKKAEYELIKNNYNKQYMLNAVKDNPSVIRYASQTLCNDPEFVIESIKGWSYNFIYASKKIKNNYNFILEASKINKEILFYASEKIQKYFINYERRKNYLLFLYHINLLEKSKNNFINNNMITKILSLKEIQINISSFL